MAASTVMVDTALSGALAVSCGRRTEKSAANVRPVAEGGRRTSNTRGEADPQGIHPACGLEATLTHIDWSVELKKIEREFDGLPPEPTPAELRQRREAERRDEEEQDARTGAFGVYLRLTLVLSLCLGMLSWPYDVSCGASLFGYMIAVATVAIGGFWTSLTTWRHRMPRSHVVALLVLLWGLGLAASQVLPRVGYASPAPDRATTWRCG